MIPVYEPLLSDDDLFSVECALSDGHVSGHSPIIERFEEAFAEYIGVKHAIAVSSGTAALEVALHAVGVSEGDEVILPSFTIISCAVAVLRLGAIPVLVDVDPDTWCIDPEGVEKAITDATKAVMPVDMMGHPANYNYLPAVVGRGKETPAQTLMYVEDACQAHGAKENHLDMDMFGADWINCGAFGNAAAFSFYANKLITTGEGGMVTTDDDSIAEKARSYRNLYLGSGPDRFRCPVLGYNFRLGGLQAALGLSQLETVDERLAIKRRNARMYRNRLAGVEGLRLQIEQPWAKSAHWMVGIVLDNMLASDMIEALRGKGVDSRPFFVGLHEQPALHGKLSKNYNHIQFYPNSFRGTWGMPVTEQLSRYGLYLPSGLTLTEDDIDYVCDTVKQILAAQ